tara:strand:- start:16 stop:357 length:342 start_codon:yes stop_codon:yes gene_type:complete
MCSGRKSQRQSPQPLPDVVGRQPNAKDSGRMMGRIDKTQKPYTDQLPPAPTEPKSRTINRTIKPGTTVRGQQRTESTAPSRRRIKSARMGRRSGTNSLRIARGSNTGSGNLNY